MRMLDGALKISILFGLKLASFGGLAADAVDVQEASAPVAEASTLPEEFQAASEVSNPVEKAAAEPSALVEEPQQLANEPESPIEESYPVSVTTSLREEDRNANGGVMVGMQQPSFNALKYYDLFYGPTSWQPAITMYRFFASTSFLQLGWGLNFTGYSDVGKQQEAISAGDPKDKNDFETLGGKASLTLLTWRLQLMTKLKIPRFRYFDFNAWGGYGEVGFQEVLEIGAAEAQAMANSGTTTNSGGNARPTVYYGWQSEIGLGASFNIYLNFLEEKSGRDLKRSLGFDRIYLSPYFEVISKMGNRGLFGKSPKDLSFAREVMGIAFTFEG